MIRSLLASSATQAEHIPANKSAGSSVMLALQHDGQPIQLDEKAIKRCPYLEQYLHFHSLHDGTCSLAQLGTLELAVPDGVTSQGMQGALLYVRGGDSKLLLNQFEPLEILGAAGKC